MNRKEYPPVKIGDKFDRLTVIKEGKNINYHRYWWCECKCGNIKEIVETNLNNGHTKSCGCLNIEAIDKYNNSKHKLSFYDWCKINNMLDELLKRWDYDLNEKSPENVAFMSNKKFWFKCIDNPLHGSEEYKIDRIVTYYGNGSFQPCKQCNSFAQWGIDNISKTFLTDYWDYNKNTKNPWSINYSHNGKVFIKCLNNEYHGSYEIRPNKFVHGGRCGFCYGNKTHILDSFGTIYPDSLKVWSDKNIKSPYDYTYKSNYKVFFKCENKIHDDYKRSISEASKCRFRCPECVRERTESFLQEMVRTYIVDEYKYRLRHEHKCSIIPHNPNTGKSMPFDNEVIVLKLIIEVHGERHYRTDGYTHQLAKKRSTTIEYELEQQKWRDAYKKEYALSQGYYYLEIPYWTEKDESYKILIDNKISEILDDRKNNCV